MRDCRNDRVPELNHIIMPNSKRIAWFLALQRVFHFPRHFIAPLVRSFVRHSTVHPDSDTKDRLRSKNHVTEASLASFSHGRDLPDLIRHVPSISTIADRPPAVPRLQLKDFGDRSGNPRRWKPDLVSAERVMSSTSPQTNASRMTDPGRSLDTSPVYNHPSLLAAANPLALLRSPLPSPASMHLAPRITNRYSPRSDLYSSITKSTDVDSKPAAFSTVKRVESKNSRTDFNQSDQEEPDEYANNSSMHSERQSASILHIDGSALGRWAIQHFERALGKPTAGMTGIDPRATVPRSRVAPF